MRVNVMYSGKRKSPKFWTGFGFLLTLFFLYTLFGFYVKLVPRISTAFLEFFIAGQNAVFSVQNESHEFDFINASQEALKLLFGVEHLSAESVVMAQVPVLKVYDPSLGKMTLEEEEPVLKESEITVTPSRPLTESHHTLNTLKISNSAGVSFDQEALLNESLSLSPLNSSEPQVLIVHTHTTEAYTPTKVNPYEASGDDRTLDLQRSVARVGEELQKELTKKGINVIQDKTIHDTMFSKSYTTTLPTIEGYLEKFPTIQVVIDLHRDALYYDDGTKLQVTAEIEGQTVAQSMLVVGTDQGGLSHPNWRENLKFALHLQKSIEESFPGLMRALNIAPYRYNQHTTNASIILEMGASGNTLEEVLLSCPYIAEGIYKTLSGV